jgi:vancomycin resistance protein VanJ
MTGTAVPIAERRRGAPRIALIAAVYPAALLALSAVHLVAPQRSGVLALSQILAPHLFAGLVPVLALLLWRPAWRGPLPVLSLAAAVVAAVRFGPGFVSLPASQTPGAPTLTVTSWNLEAGQPPVEAVLEALKASPASILALQELTPRHADAIVTDPDIRARYPHRVLAPRDGSFGMGLLSAHPILDEEVRSGPAVIRVRLAMPGGRTLTVIDVHPFPGRIDVAGDLRIPLDYDPSERDAALREIRDLVDRAAAGPDDGVLLVGDLNVSDREPAYREIADGLHDAYREVGWGPGGTWRPSRLEALPFGLLRIDHMLSTAAVRPLRLAVDCTPRGSDHCILTGTFELPAG